VNEDYSSPLWMEAFLSPGSALGVLIQLAQSPMDQKHQDLHWGESSLEEFSNLLSNTKSRRLETGLNGPPRPHAHIRPFAGQNGGRCPSMREGQRRAQAPT
jgi:hypothetical protein